MSKTNIKIDEEIIQKTNYCERNFSCLSEEKPCFRKAKHFIWVDLLEIHPNDTKDFIYRVSMSNTCFCQCPTRNELFKKYNI